MFRGITAILIIIIIVFGALNLGKYAGRWLDKNGAASAAEVTGEPTGPLAQARERLAEKKAAEAKASSWKQEAESALKLYGPEETPAPEATGASSSQPPAPTTTATPTGTTTIVPPGTTVVNVNCGTDCSKPTPAPEEVEKPAETTKRPPKKHVVVKAKPLTLCEKLAAGLVAAGQNGYYSFCASGIPATTPAAR
ncbi:MAG: hypothetical protein WC801_00570 [Patescibacteria group bacterium]|jgi:hypothetical protein